MKKSIFVAFMSCILLLVVTSCKEGKAQETPTVELITVSDMQEAIIADDIQLIDVRTQAEFASGHIKDAKNIVYQGKDWDEQVASLDKNKPVYVYCAKGGRSAKCASKLKEAGFTKIFDLDGGVTKWINEGKEVVK